MKQNLLTKHCALLLLLALAPAWSTPAWALTINVKASQEPYVYAWDNDQNPLLDAYPGTKLTNTKNVGGQTWYYIDIDATNVNLILSFGTDDTKTGDINNIAGNRYFEFANNNANNVTDYYDIPNGVSYQSNPFTCVVNASNWSGDLYAYAWGNGYSGEASSWPGKKMTKVGTNGNGNDVYEWVSDSQTAPAQVIFNNNSGSQTSDLPWSNGAYWSNYGNDNRITISGVILNNTNFPDANLRAAITASTGVAEGGAITINNIKVLDISNHGITNTTGITYFTELEELYANNNDISFIDLENAINLRILDLHQNENLLGFGTGTPSTSNHIARLPSGCLQYIDMSNTRLRNYTAAAFANKVAGTLETFIARDVYYTSDPAKLAFNNIPSVTSLTKLKYLDVSGCDGTPVTIVADLANMKSTLEYLDISNQHMTTTGADPALDGFTALKTFKFNNQSTWTKALSINNCPLLTYIDVSGNTAMTGLTINNSGITTLNFPEATTLTDLSALATLNVSNNPFTVLNIPQTPNSLLTVTANNCSLMTRILAEHNKSKLQYVTAHNCPALTDITINGADIYYNKQLNAFDATNKSTLVTLDLSNDAMSTNYALDGFTALQTVDFDNNYMEGNNNNLHEFTATNCPALTTVNLGGNANMQTVTLTNNGFSNISYPLVTVDAGANNVILDFSDNNFSDVPNIQASQINVLKLNNNQLTDINIPTGCNVNYLYAQNNNFGSGDYTLPTTSLVGLDLGYNGFTKFKAENNNSLKSLALAGNTALTEIELHGNTALTQTSPDGVIESDNGLYIKGLSKLQTLNIENSSFNKFGQQNSLEGVTGLTKLQARHNEFTTFTNGVYALDVAGTGNYRKPDNTESSLEHLTALEYLDLAYNNLQDSVHLYKNVALKHLDVSHNNEIHGVIDGTITADNTAAQEAMRTKKAKRLVKYGMYYGEKGELNDALYAQACADQAGRQVRFDIRYEDLNDTTGIYHLDLQKNVNLEWIDISYTNIHNTAAGPGVMNPGWMSRDWVGDSDEALAATVHANTTTQRSYSAFHTFVYFAPCSKLKTIHMDHCNLQSLGISYFPELDTLTASYMYGDCYFMRDATKTDLKYGMANTGPGRVRKYLSPKTNTETGIQDAVNVVGPDGTANTYYDNNIKYYDISYSGFNELRFNYGINLEHVNVSGNPLKFHVHPNTDYSYYNSLDVTYCPNIRTVIADNCSDLPTVRAYNLASLDTLKLDNDPLLKTVYMQNNLAMNHFTGLSSLSGLETLFAYNNTQFGGIDVSNNAALKNLWVSNIGASAIDVSQNTALEKLRVYDNSLQALDVASNPALTWLDLARNQVPSMDLSANAALQYFNCSNSEETLNDPSLTANNHNGAEGDNVKPVSGTAQASNGGNSLSDLVFYSNIGDVRACYNDLHCIKPGTDRSSSGSFANLTNIEFAHNHINGIDLSAATNPTVNSEDNGRTILADCAKFTPHGDFGNVVTVYFFQLEDVQNGTLLTLKTSEDSKGATRVLGTDGLVLDNINWNQGNSAVLPKNVTLDPSNMGDYLDPDDVPGTIVVLEAANETGNGADGRATYTYDNGAGTSTFYLDWSSDGTITGINSVIGENGFDLAGTYGGIVVAGKDGTIVGVYDTNGRQIASETISGGKITIDGLAPGIYIVNGNKVLVK